MKITCSKSNLVKGVSIVSKAVPSKTTMPILECILIDATTDIIKLTANDMELGIMTEISGDIIDRGMIAIDAKIFSEIVRKLPDNEVTIETLDNLQTVITCEKAKFDIAGKPGDEFAYLPIIEKEDSIEISQILPDIPYEEKDEFDGICKQYDVDLISLIAPTSHERISMIANDANGFVYCVSSLGVTGTRTKITTDIGAMVDLVKKAKDIPCAVGFGISTPEQAKQMAEKSDGVIVGSAIVKLCAQYGKDCVPYVRDYVKSMKDAIR